jgi:copper chaperone CopZ
MSERSVSIAIEGMSCEGCVASVKHVLSRVAGVRVVDVSVGKASVAVDDAKATEHDLVRAIEKAGFRPTLGGRPA